jgi:hypothetical protein
VEVLEIFLSWSKPASYKVAITLRDWLNDVFPNAKCWVSKDNIEKGRPWFRSICEQLAKSQVCIICITPENAESKWIYYEAGAVAFVSDTSRICPFLFKVGHDAISDGPLGQYQATIVEKDDVWSLVKTLNGVLVQPNNETILRNAFEHKWSNLEEELSKIQPAPAASSRKGAGIATAKIPLQLQTISLPAKELLLSLVKCELGKFMVHEEQDGSFFGNIHLSTDDPDYAKQFAGYKAALEELRKRKLARPENMHGDDWYVTKEGFEAAELFLAENPPIPPQLTNEYDIIAELQAWFGKNVKWNSPKPVIYEEVDKQLNLPAGSAKRLIARAAEKQLRCRNSGRHTSGFPAFQGIQRCA